MRRRVAAPAAAPLPHARGAKPALCGVGTSENEAIAGDTDAFL